MVRGKGKWSEILTLWYPRDPRDGNKTKDRPKQ